MPTIWGKLREWGLDFTALEHFRNEPPDDWGGTLYIDGVAWPVRASGGTGHIIQDEGSDLTARDRLNFVGAGVSVTDDSGNGATKVTISGGGGGGHTVQEEGVDLTARAYLNFVGDGVVASDDAGNDATVITVNNAVDSVNGQTGTVVLDPDDLDDSATTNKFNVTHTGDVTGATALTIANDAVSNAKLANMAESTFKGRAASSGTGDPVDLTATQARTILNVADGANAYVHPNHSGDVTSVADGATTIAAEAVTNAKLAHINQYELKGRATSGAGDVEDITTLQLRQLFMLRSGSTTSSATPTINTDTYNYYALTAQAVDITSFTTNLSGTPVEGQKLIISITGTATRNITWGTSFESSTVTLPSATDGTNRLDIGLIWNSATSKWRCVAVS